MKKIKISELPEYQSLTGLYTIGTDSQNRSVKVSLEWIQTTTNNAVSAANDAAALANQKAGLANDAAALANQKAGLAADAAALANQKAELADTKAGLADEKATLANQKAGLANEAAQNANDKATLANTKAELADQKAGLADEAATAANAAKDAVLAAWGSLVPSAMSVVAPLRLTLGNLQPNFITPVLSPTGVARNVIYQSDNEAVSIEPDGRIVILKKGISRVHVIPTLNTGLHKTIAIEVTEPTARFVNTRAQLRFTSSGAFRLN